MLATLRCLFMVWKMCSSLNGMAGLKVTCCSAGRIVPSALASERAAPFTPPGPLSEGQGFAGDCATWSVISYPHFGALGRDGSVDITAVANAALFRLAQRKPNEGRHRGRPSVSPLPFSRLQRLAC